MTITIKDISTRELKSELRCRQLDHYREDETKEGFALRRRVASRPAKGGEGWDVAVATTDELKAELDTRPHLPGKAEGKLLRRLMSQTGRTADQLRANTKYGEMLADAQHPNRRKVSPEEAARLMPIFGNRFGSIYKVVT